MTDLGPKAQAALTKVRQLFKAPDEADLALHDLMRGLIADNDEEVLAGLRAFKRDAVAFGVSLDEFAKRFADFLVEMIEERRPNK